jgi:predicted TIM-barrel fold metal-dependent hydrolase
MFIDASAHLWKKKKNENPSNKAGFEIMHV